MNTSPNRVVAIATPLVFAPLAGAITALAAKYAPGLDIDQGQLEAIFIAGATIAFAKSGLWLKGWQDHEKRQDAATAAAVQVSADDRYAQPDEYVEDEDEDDFGVDEIHAVELDADDLDVDEDENDVLVERAA